MVEHISGFFRVSTNKLHFPLATPPERLPKFKEFLRSDKEFRENTKAPVLPEEPIPVQFASFDDAVNDLEKEITDFLEQFIHSGRGCCWSSKLTCRLACRKHEPSGVGYSGASYAAILLVCGFRPRGKLR
jgi:hypothetical protein